MTIFHQVIGTTTIEAGRIDRQSSEVARWYHDYELTPGTYDVIAGLQPGGGYVRLHAKVPGVCVSADTTALFGGVPIGSSTPQGTDHRDVGSTTVRMVAVNLSDVTLNEDAGEHVSRMWIEGLRAVEFSGYGLKVEGHYTLVRTDFVWGCDYRLDPNDGSLPEFMSDAHQLVKRVNELQAAGFDPDVWRVAYTADGLPWFETPIEDHRPYATRKFPYSRRRPQAQSNWRYYRPDYNPRAA